MKFKTTTLLIILSSFTAFSQGIFECGTDESDFTPGFFDPIG